MAAQHRPGAWETRAPSDGADRRSPARRRRYGGSGSCPDPGAFQKSPKPDSPLARRIRPADPSQIHRQEVIASVGSAATDFRKIVRAKPLSTRRPKGSGRQRGRCQSLRTSPGRPAGRASWAKTTASGFAREVTTRRSPISGIAVTNSHSDEDMHQHQRGQGREGHGQPAPTKYDNATTMSPPTAGTGSFGASRRRDTWYPGIPRSKTPTETFRPESSWHGNQSDLHRGPYHHWKEGSGAVLIQLSICAGNRKFSTGVPEQDVDEAFAPRGATPSALTNSAGWHATPSRPG